MFFNRTAPLFAAFFLSACAALNVIHDPQSGLINRAQVPKLLQSVRCELVTYFDVNETRQDSFLTNHKYIGPFFPLDESQLGAVFLDLKVMDNLSIPSGPTATTINEKVASNHAADTRTWHLGPNASDTNTYELNWPLTVPQSAKLDLARPAPGGHPDTDPYFPCYRRTPNPPDSEKLAHHEVPELEKFSRIYVDGHEPLAAWLLRSSAELNTALWPQVDPKAISTERIVPAQMIYTFTVQAGVGADASESLITAKWNPIGLDLSASTQQTSMLTIYINGYDSLNANGAKTGIIQVVQDPNHRLSAFVKNAPCPSPLCSNAQPKYPIAIVPPQPQ